MDGTVRYRDCYVEHGAWGDLMTKQRLPEIINRVCLEGHYFETGYCNEGTAESGPIPHETVGFRWGQIFLTLEDNRDVCLWINPKGKLAQGNGWSMPILFVFKRTDVEVREFVSSVRQHQKEHQK